jgi:iron complex transport system ATP-binding protein
MLSATHLTYTTGGKTLLNDVTVTFLPNKLNLIIGPNGAGKSTLVKLLCNQLKPQSGSIFYGNKNVSTLSISALSKMRAVLSQNIDLAFPLNVSEVVMMGRYPHFDTAPRTLDKNICEEAMHFFDVLDFSDRNYMTLSGGEKQRVQFARVMSQIWQPIEGCSRYLILDEPLTFLDVRYQFQFMHKLIELKAGKDLVIIGVVHDLNLVSRFADEVVLLSEGKLLSSGTKETVLTKEHIKEAYHLEPMIHFKNDQRYLFFE